MAAAAGDALSEVPGGTAARHAAGLLRALGRSEVVSQRAEHPAAANARCGLLALSGPSSTPWMPPAALASCAEGTLAALRALPGGQALAGIDGAALLGERAACDRLSRAGAVSAGGACRILPCLDGWLAVQLARPDDWAMLPAWLETDGIHNWPTLGLALQARSLGPLLERAGLLGLAVADCAPPPAEARSWFQEVVAGPMRASVADRVPRVLDLSSLWAGPLSTHLLQLLGAQVVKLESLQRPDGARAGNTDFFDLMNAEKDCVALDFGSGDGIRQLRALIARADIVIEAARPRALQQLGIDAEALVADQPGLCWISINGYGRDGEAAMRPAYGDDAGAAAGLSWMMQQAHGAPCFVGDAIADPLTGLHAALRAWSAWLEGRGGLWSLAMRDVVAHCIAASGDSAPDAVAARARDWQAELAAAGLAAMPPQARRPAGSAHGLGADNRLVLERWGLAC